MKPIALGKVLLLIPILCALASPIGSAQTPAASSQTQANPREKEAPQTGVYSGRDVYVPDTKPPAEPEPAARSFADGFLRDTRGHLGFSLGAFETYTPGALPSSSGDKALYFTSILPEAYVNLQKKRIAFRLTYGVRYNRYNEQLSSSNNLSQNGDATLSYAILRRKATWQFSNFVASNFYDESSFLGMGLTTPYWTSLGPQTYLDRRRETRDVAIGSFSYTVTKKFSVSASLNYDLARYRGFNSARRNALTGGVGASYLLKKWLSFNTQYSHYLNTGARQLGGNDIQSLQVGGLSIEPGRGWVVSFSGGIDSTRAAGTRRVVASGQAGISKTSRRTTVALAYHRGLFTVFPATQVSYGDTANIHFVQSFSRRISLHADSSYIRSSALTTSALTPSYVMNTVYGSTGLDVVIEKNLVFSSNFFLVSQNLGNASFPGSNLHRRTATIGINYYLPAVGSERNR